MLLNLMAEKLGSLPQQKFRKINRTFSEYQQSRMEGLEILEKSCIVYRLSIEQLKETEKTLGKENFELTLKFLNKFEDEIINDGWMRFKNHVRDIMEVIETVAPKDFGRKINFFQPKGGLFDLSPFRTSLLDLTFTPRALEMKDVDRDLEFMTEARINTLNLLEGLSEKIEKLRRNVKASLLINLPEDFEILGKTFEEMKASLETSYTLRAWGFSQNLSPSQMKKSLDDTIALSKILANVRHILSPSTPLQSKSPPLYEETAEHLQLKLLDILKFGSEVLVAKCEFKNGHQASNSLHWLWGPQNQSMDHFPHQLIPDSVFSPDTNALRLQNSQEFQELFRSLSLKFKEAVNMIPFSELSSELFDRRSVAIESLIQVNDHILHLMKLNKNDVYISGLISHHVRSPLQSFFFTD
ncbi:hypothetical protein CROQUDRAFT_291357 [Cronartium quercuum f. sp. fusiforme G11]|uniref:Uncharacterized protein n=1 Tax=Cronartium quercuum f. sp. fusiforme G11 TaxID=708437 RepID=A0A9P6TFH7_9BASI|nr:hypothetical protein CROQUDRAFT_291357 [Cronartium quercuum f. sp. fusiforme G11]